MDEPAMACGSHDMIKVVMREELTGFEPPNPSLWVRLAPRWGPDPQMRWLIAGSAHTHRGHFHVCSSAGDEHRSVNADDVVEMSPEAASWLDGFLQGQQADLWDFLGRDHVLFEAADADDVARWREWNDRFRRLGYGHLNTLPARTPRLSEFTAPAPWCYVGGRYRIWRDADWLVADPQPNNPDGEDGFWPGSACATLGEHDLEQIDADLTICQRCHEASI